RADAAQDVLGRFADAEEQNDQRDPGDGGDGAQQLKDGLEDGFRPAGGAHGDAQHDADDRGDREADQHAAQADQQVADDDLAADGRVEGGEQQLQHLDGAGGGLLDRGEGGQEPPQHEETGDGRHRVERFFGVDFLDLFTHPRRPPLTNFFSSAFRPTVKIV